MKITTATLIAILRDPSGAVTLSPGAWTHVVALARRELVLGHLAATLQQSGQFSALPARLQAMLEDGLRDALFSQRIARSEAQFAAAALRDIGCPVVVMKGSAYVLAGLPCAAGRLAGDLDLMVPRSYLGAAELALKQGGWQLQVKDAYDDQYYRIWMHELPPMVHAQRKTLLDMHHTILPLTGRVQPDARALMQAAVALPGTTLHRFGNADMILHSAAHLIQDGDGYGGLRNLHDIHRLVTDFALTPDFWPTLAAHTRKHNLQRCLYYALSASQRLFGTPVPSDFWMQLPGARPAAPTATLMAWLIDTRLGGRRVDSASPAYVMAEKLLYVRAHHLRMPPRMLARHLLRKQWLRWRANRAA